MVWAELSRAEPGVYYNYITFSLPFSFPLPSLVLSLRPPPALLLLPVFPPDPPSKLLSLSTAFNNRSVFASFTFIWTFSEATATYFLISPQSNTSMANQAQDPTTSSSPQKQSGAAAAAVAAMNSHSGAASLARGKACLRCRKRKMVRHSCFSPLSLAHVHHCFRIFFISPRSSIEMLHMFITKISAATVSNPHVLSALALTELTVALMTMAAARRALKPSESASPVSRLKSLSFVIPPHRRLLFNKTSQSFSVILTSLPRPLRHRAQAHH